MTLILRMCNKDGSSRNEFKYGQVGERVTAPDWNPEPECGNGLHGLKEGNGNWDLLEGDDWLIIDADDQIVNIGQDKCKFNTGIILFRGNKEELSKSEFPNKLKLDSLSAFFWAYNIGNHDIMINKINDSFSAYHWAMFIGNRDIMIDKITDSYNAYYWALDIGDRDIMINKITNPIILRYWEKYIGLPRDICNHDRMILNSNKIES